MKKKLVFYSFILVFLVCSITSCSQSQREKDQGFISIQSVIRNVAVGRGVEEAAIYNSKAPGPHKLILLNSAWDLHEMNNELPTEWLPSDIDETELVVVLGSEYKVTIGRAAYEGGYITRSVYVVDATIREANSGDILLEGKIIGDEPREFPQLTERGRDEFPGKPVEIWEVVDWLYPTVWGRTLQGNNETITALAYSKNGKQLAYATSNNSINLLEFKNDDFQQSTFAGTVSEFPKHFTNLKYSSVISKDSKDISIVSPFGSLLAVVNQDKKVIVVPMDGSSEPRELFQNYYKGSVVLMVFHRDAEDLAIITKVLPYPFEETTTPYLNLNIYHLPYNMSKHEIKLPFTEVIAVAFSFDGKEMAFAGIDGSIFILPAKGLLEYYNP